MRIIVMCAAGASSTFVAQRLRGALIAAGRDGTARAAPTSALPDCLDDADVLLLGPHLAPAADELREHARSRGVAIAVLPDDIFTDRDGARALALADGAAEGIHLARHPAVHAPMPHATVPHPSAPEATAPHPPPPHPAAPQTTETTPHPAGRREERT
ncbi:PTS sugar transporter subunit IIB [Microbacterium luticocti]|uniref:PTS sugar transporter subunit IIB n=1 Tax=Microbacterium luticocti TaxID=451764 RepID=UPI000414D3DC|nr:hypothetical protein [Microbacterium luticocti]